MAKILIVNGPNLNKLGQREPEIYGDQTLDEINNDLTGLAQELEVELEFFQSNSEGGLIDYLQAEAEEANALIINPGAFTHYSVALRDAIVGSALPTVEVHLTNVQGREKFRRRSLIAPICLGVISGFGAYGYAMALSYFASLLTEED